MTPEQRIEQLEKIVSLLVSTDRLTFQKNIQVFDARNIQLGKTTGTQIGTEGGATGQKIGFFGATPVAQQLKANHNGWAAFTDVVSALKNLGLIDST